ncbi:helix-turn-helix domain-containing protein [Acinetobacter sp. NIPH1876]|uniref:helix-turn-helix transcriptional regulator n=1 Tax=Acinetobacter sp. NIPH1876 TaxID=2924041 RepID=UPI001FADF25B|nr:helix-turn-helix transcriptional regulator [Acinetobacter sp. NIPH1876]MCJ0830421.1 helix-turn-helix domain-containing protein [Acinetobacter sp. NIPH1876]
MDNNVSNRLKSERDRLGLSQGVIAAQAEVTVKTVGRWEKEIAIPSDKLALLKILGVDLLFVLTGERTQNGLAQDETVLIDKYRQADSNLKNKLLMLLLGVENNTATKGVVNNETNTGVINQLNGKNAKIDNKNEGQTNNFNGNFGGDFVNGDKH